MAAAWAAVVEPLLHVVHSADKESARRRIPCCGDGRRRETGVEDQSKAVIEW